MIILLCKVFARWQIVTKQCNPRLVVEPSNSTGTVGSASNNLVVCAIEARAEDTVRKGSRVNKSCHQTSTPLHHQPTHASAAH